MHFYRSYLYYIATVSLAVFIALLSSCGDRPVYDPPPETDTEDHFGPTTDICGTSEGYHRHECSKKEYLYEITRNERVDGKLKDKLVDGTYYTFWSQLGAKFRWEVEFIPKDGETSRQMRFVVSEEELPPPVKLQRQPKSSNSAAFSVDLTNQTGCYDGSDQEEDDEDNEDEEDVEDVECESLKKWVKNPNNKEGNIHVFVQDVSYCYLQNRRNKDIASNLVDCSDPDIGSSYYRTSTVDVPYILDFNGTYSQLFCSVTDGIGAVSSTLNPWVGVVTAVGRVVLDARCKPKDS